MKQFKEAEKAEKEAKKRAKLEASKKEAALKKEVRLLYLYTRGLHGDLVLHVGGEAETGRGAASAREGGGRGKSTGGYDRFFFFYWQHCYCHGDHGRQPGLRGRRRHRRRPSEKRGRT